MKVRENLMIHRRAMSKTKVQTYSYMKFVHNECKNFNFGQIFFYARVYAIARPSVRQSVCLSLLSWMDHRS